jgi:phage baseplate assembly protein W
MRDRAVHHIGASGHFKRSAAVVARQPGDMRSNRNAVVDNRDANESYRDVAVFEVVMNLDFPYHFDGAGRTATATDDKHIRDLIEEVLFTSPGERVNRPDFGSGVLRLVFAPNSDEMATATQFLVQASLQQWLGDLIQVDEVQVDAEDAELRITVVYTIRRSQQQQTAQFTSGGGAR